MTQRNIAFIVIGGISLIWLQPLIILAWITTKVVISFGLPMAILMISARTVIWIFAKATNQTDENWWESVKFRKYDEDG